MLQLSDTVQHATKKKRTKPFAFTQHRCSLSDCAQPNPALNSLALGRVASKPLQRPSTAEQNALRLGSAQAAFCSSSVVQASGAGALTNSVFGHAGVSSGGE